MAKRVIVKPGDIFYVTIKGKYRRYFQYIVRDRNCFNADLIRVFKRQYDVDETPEEEAIVNDEVAFYTHTYITNGIHEGFWDKYGKYPIPQDIDVSEVIFGYYIGYTPRGKWDIYSVNGPFIENVKWPGKPVEAGELHSISSIAERLKTGVDLWTMRNFGPMTVKRIVADPFPESVIYVKKNDENGIARYYYKYRGKYLIEEICIKDFETVYVKDRQQLQKWYRFSERQLNDYDWNFPATEYEYEAARRGKLLEYNRRCDEEADKIRTLLLDNYYCAAKFQYVKSAELVIDIIPRGFSLRLRTKMKKTKEVIETDRVDVEIPMQNVDFCVFYLNDIMESARRQYMSEFGLRQCQRVTDIFVDDPLFGVYRDFEAEGFKF